MNPEKAFLSRLTAAPSPLAPNGTTAMATIPAMCASISVIQMAIGNKSALTSMEKRKIISPEVASPFPLTAAPLPLEHPQTMAMATKSAMCASISTNQTAVGNKSALISMEKPMKITQEAASLFLLMAAPSSLVLLETTAMAPVLAMCASMSSIYQYNRPSKGPSSVPISPMSWMPMVSFNPPPTSGNPVAITVLLGLIWTKRVNSSIRPPHPWSAKTFESPPPPSML